MKRGSVAVAMIVLFLFAFAFSASVMIAEAEAAVCAKCSQCWDFWEQEWVFDGGTGIPCVPHGCYRPECNQP